LFGCRTPAARLASAPVPDFHTPPIFSRGCIWSWEPEINSLGCVPNSARSKTAGENEYQSWFPGAQIPSTDFLKVDLAPLGAETKTEDSSVDAFADDKARPVRLGILNRNG